jgi:hypothetical protein
LDRKSLSVEQAKQVERDLLSLNKFNTIADSLDSMERLLFIDAIIQVAVRNKDAQWLSKFGVKLDAANQQLIDYSRIDWNVALRKGNRFYDRLAAAARLSDRQARKQAISQIKSDINRLVADSKRPGTLVGGVINPSSRNDTIASLMLGIFMPAQTLAMDAEDRANTILELQQLASALAVYRAEHGEYPAKLEQLVLDVIRSLPLDVFNNKSFIYKRTPDGYLLYSAGENSVDDGGSNANAQIFEGHSPPDSNSDEAEKIRQKIPTSADDLPIRMPRPSFKMPDFRIQPESAESTTQPE